MPVLPQEAPNQGRACGCAEGTDAPRAVGPSALFGASSWRPWEGGIDAAWGATKKNEVEPAG